MKSFQKTLVPGLMLLILIPGISRAFMIDDHKYTAASVKHTSMKLDDTGKTGFLSCVSPAPGMGSPSDYATESWGASPVVPTLLHAQAVLLDKYIPPHMSAGAETTLLLFFGAGFMAIGLAVKGVGKKELRSAPRRENLPHRVSSFTESPLRAE
jgi:hypothetical protein